MDPVLITRVSRSFQPAKYSKDAKCLIGAGNMIEPSSLTPFGVERIEVYGEDSDILKSKYYAEALSVAQECNADYVLVKSDPKILDVSQQSNKIDEVISLYLTK